jgi:hypothetical protein
MVDRIMVGRIHGTVGVEGNHLLLMWFRGLIRKVVPIGSAGPPRQALPGAYVAHDPSPLDTSGSRAVRRAAPGHQVHRR